MNDQTALTGQQLAALQKQMAEKMTGIVKDVELRKWAVDQACSLVGAAHEQPDGKITFPDPVALARGIHAFLTEGASDPK